MNEITQKLQELAKARKIPKLVYKQTNQKKTSVFITDALVE